MFKFHTAGIVHSLIKFAKKEIMEDISKHPVYSRQVIELITVANEYCLYVEKFDDYNKNESIEYLRHVLPLLYLKASLVPLLTPSNPEESERYVTEEVWEALFNSIRNKFYPDDHFWMGQDAHDETTDVEKFSLAECLSDIYQDMKDFIMLYQKKHSSRENAVSDVTNWFRERTGLSIIRSQYALHLLFMKALGS